MQKHRLVCGVAVIAMTATAVATEYPLTFQTLTVDEAMAFPGGSGAYGSLSVNKPPSLRKEPKAVSKRPLYGEVGRTGEGKGLVFRVDEVGGDGKGYDRVIVDFNQNGDLTDDPIGSLAAKSQTTKSAAEVRETSRFGPMKAPVTKQIGPWQPVYYAELIYYHSRPGLSSSLPSAYLGQFRLKAGFYLETTVELDGVKQRVGVVDGDANLRLGDESKPMTYKSSGVENWYFAPADSYLQDRDGSGKFESNAANTESSPFGSMLYFGATPYRVGLAADRTSLRVEPWSDALAELVVQPRGEQVRDVLLAWERSTKEWVLIKAGVAQGKTKVPPGNLRFSGCVLAGQAAPDEQLMISGSYRKLDHSIKTRVGQTATLRCGPPLEMRVTTLERKVSELPNPPDGASEDNKARGALSDVVLQIRAELVGAAGETCSAFAAGRNLAGEPPKPRFTILTRDGKEVASGNLEFG